MKFNIFFKEKILPFNGQIVELSIIHISQHNHPLGPIGAMLMGNQQTERVQLAVNHYDGVDALIKLNAKMEFIANETTEKIVFTISDYNCNKIEIFRPNPPMFIEDKDMSLWWSYYSDNDESGDSFPIRDILVNGISHCLQPLEN
mgnify:CR=1 FL=1